MRQAKYLIIVCALVLAGCATAPKTPQQTLAVTDAQFTGLVQTATDLVKAGTIHGADAQHVRTLVDQGSAALDQAWALESAGSSYSDPLSIVISVDQALQAILQRYAQQVNNNG